MEVCRNMATGKHFIYINESGVDEALLVTPNAEIKSLRNNLFTDLDEYSEGRLLASKMITSEQIRKFNEYKKNRAQDEADDILHQLSPPEQLRVIQELKKAFGKEEIKVKNNLPTS